MHGSGVAFHDPAHRRRHSGHRSRLCEQSHFRDALHRQRAAVAAGNDPECFLSPAHRMPQNRLKSVVSPSGIGGWNRSTRWPSLLPCSSTPPACWEGGVGVRRLRGIAGTGRFAAALTTGPPPFLRIMKKEIAACRVMALELISCAVLENPSAALALRSPT